MCLVPQHERGGGTARWRHGTAEKCGFRPSIPDLVHRSRGLPRDFRGICVRVFLMSTARNPRHYRLSPQYPQRDSNPCRHLERDSRRDRSERQRPERAKSRGSADTTTVDGGSDSERPRDFRGVVVGAPQSFGRIIANHSPGAWRQQTSARGDEASISDGIRPPSQATAALSAESWICTVTRSPERLITRALSGIVGRGRQSATGATASLSVPTHYSGWLADSRANVPSGAWNTVEASTKRRHASSSAEQRNVRKVIPFSNVS